MAAILVLPSTARGQQGPVAALVSTAGWAAAMDRHLGQAWIVTPSGTVDAAAARRAASDPSLGTGVGRRWTRYLPAVVATALKDGRQLRQARAFRVSAAGPWTGAKVDLVWQRHELFHTAGLDLAEELGVPSVLFVPAPAVWEAARWGVRRPGWGRWAERLGEARALRRADVVACGTSEVLDQVLRLGVDESRVVITPTGVDVDLFDAAAAGLTVRDELGLTGQRVVGWAGSFRPFHSLPVLVRAVAGLPDTTLLLVGDGPERVRIERMARDLGVRARFTGTVPHERLPAHLAAMDVAAVATSPGQDFHYSPLKLGEYLAAGVPVVAPDLASIRARGVGGLRLVVPGDEVALREALTDLLADPSAREALGVEARAAARRHWSWDHQVASIMEALATRPGRTTPTR